MAKNNKQILFDGAFRIVSLSKEISITEFAINILTQYGKLTSENAGNYTLKYARSISNNFKQQNNSLRKKGLTPIAKILPGDRISWITTDLRTIQVWKARPILLEIIDNFNDDEFEALCCVVIELIGGKSWKTKKKGDGNVDLYAYISTKLENHIFGKNSKLKIVAQCKNYDHPESITNFESFYRALDNVKFQASRVISEMPNEFSREHGAILGWYICKDGFQKGIYNDAKKHGITLSDKYDLVEILVNIPIVGISSLPTLMKLNIRKHVHLHLN